MAMIGLGDVFIPGLLIVFAYRIDHVLGVPKRAYFATMLNRYITGLILPILPLLR